MKRTTIANFYFLLANKTWARGFISGAKLINAVHVYDHFYKSDYCTNVNYASYKGDFFARRRQHGPFKKSVEFFFELLCHKIILFQWLQNLAKQNSPLKRQRNIENIKNRKLKMLKKFKIESNPRRIVTLAKAKPHLQAPIELAFLSFSSWTSTQRLGLAFSSCTLDKRTCFASPLIQKNQKIETLRDALLKAN